MKKTIKLLFTFVFLVSAINLAKAQVVQPTFDVMVRNYVLGDTLVGDDNVLFFDIFILHTNAPTSPPFELAFNQYFFHFNPAVANGGTLSYRIVPGSSQFTNPNAIPRNPQVVGDTLKLISNITLGSGNGPIIDSIVGTRVVTMRLATTANRFAMDSLNLRFRTPASGDPFTKIFAYISQLSTDITPNGTYTVEPAGALPVELTSFISTVNKNKVTLNWATNKEINNSGFDVEGKLVSATGWTRVGNIAGNGNSNEAKNYTFSHRANTGKYNYRLKQIDYNGNFEYFPLSNEVVVGVPDKYNMSQNYPNPFNPTTKIDYDLPYDAKVSILLYDMTGREMANLVNEVKTAGYYTVQLNASDFSSGMYFYRITAQNNNNNFVMTKKMVLIK